VKEVNLPTDEDDMERIDALVNEIEVMKTLKHENIVQYLGSDRTSRKLNILMEFVPGGPLHIVMSVGRLPNLCRRINQAATEKIPVLC